MLVYEELLKLDKVLEKFEKMKASFLMGEYISGEEFNETIELFVNLSDELITFSNKNINYYLERIADNIVYVVERINNNELNKLKVLYSIDDCINAMNYLRNQLINKDKKNIVIIGITQYTGFINEIINFNEVNILAYVSLNKKIEESLMNEVFINLNDINELDADFYIVMDSNANIANLEKNKIIEYGKYLEVVYFQSPEFSVRYSDFIESQKDYEGIVTGISYTELAIDENKLSRKFVNLANPTQDLFYDFEMFKYGLNQSNNIENIKYCIIGLCLYSFNYDLSSSKVNRYRSIYYYPITNSMHNFVEKETYEEFFKHLNSKINQVFNSNSHMIIFNKYKELYKQILEQGRNKVFCSKNLSEEEKKNIIEGISKEFSKDYPETRAENKRILREYLQFLKEKRIKTIVVIPPLCKLFEEHVSKKMMEETLEIINEFKKEYEFTFIDFSKNNLFEEKHFTDGSHLNKKGSEVFTDIINKYI